MADKFSRRELLKYTALATGALATAPLVGGCAPKPTPAEPSGETEEIGGKVIWYESMPARYSSVLAERFNDSHPQLTLRAVYNRNPEVIAKVEVEAAAGKEIASLVMVASPAPLYPWREKDILLEYHSPEEEAYADWFVESGWWIGARVLDVCLLYNTDLVSEKPDSWEVIANPEHRLALCDAGTIGGAPLLWYKLTKEKFGADFWPEVVANEPLVVDSHGLVVDHCVSGEATFGEVFGYNAVTVMTENPDAPVKAVWPAPTPMVYAANAILKDGPNVEGAKAVYDWLASQEGQQTIVDVNHTISGRSDVDLGPLRPSLDEITWAPFDTQAWSDEEEDLKIEWREVFGRA